MYIVVIDDNTNKTEHGYLIVHDKRVYDEQGNPNIDSGYFFCDSYEDGTTTKHIDYTDINSDAVLLPFGEISIGSYNARVDKYLKSNGDSTRIQTPNRSIMLNGQPQPPLWPFDLQPENSESGIFDIDFQNKQYLKMAIVPINGRRYQVFDVDELSDLEEYDLKKIKTDRLRIKICEDCFHAFIGKGNSVRCSCCIKAGMRAKKKYKNQQSDPVRRNYTLIRTNIARRKWQFVNKKNYLKWFENRKWEMTEEWLKNWKTVDTNFQRLYRYFSESGTTDVSTSLCQEWYDEYKKFPNQLEHPEKWVEDWMDKIK